MAFDICDILKMERDIIKMIENFEDQLQQIIDDIFGTAREAIEYIYNLIAGFIKDLIDRIQMAIAKALAGAGIFDFLSQIQTQIECAISAIG